ncbi:MAG: RidA family protein [Proteobacteria bacterium]|nr:RidA family protein [Pseudomonadota bacterium]
MPVPKGPYSQAVVVSGRRLLFVSGQVPEDEDGNLVGPGDLEAQTRQVLTNLRRIVEGAGGNLSDIVKIGVFLVGAGPTSYEVLGRLRREFFGVRFPASTMVGVQRLASPKWLIEIEAWAALE